MLTVGKGNFNNVILRGDFWDFDRLYFAISKFTGDFGIDSTCPFPGYEAICESLLGLCYELRKAQEGKRELYEQYNGIPENGLSWLDLVKWYEQYESEDTENKLTERLCASLDSKPEKLFFRAYCEFTIKHGGTLPALIPQVYLYYDPKTKSARYNKPIFEHQRMDFMFIISREHRVVIELDGIQHYASDKTIGETWYKCADVNRYAEMMKAHREMVLDGYDVYRFGGKELYVGKDENEIPAKQTVFDFLDGLFKKYQILPKIE